MLVLTIACAAYLVFIMLGRIVNYDKNDEQSNISRAIDNIMIVALVLLICFLKR